MITGYRRGSFELAFAVCVFAAAGIFAPCTSLAQSAHDAGVLHVAVGHSVLPDSSAVTESMIDAGRLVFHGPGLCFSCHGDHLQGGPIAPTLKAHAWRDARNGLYANIYYTVSHGVPGTAMVAHPGGISDSLTILVASYVWAVSHGHAQP